MEHYYNDPCFGEHWFSFQEVYSSWINNIENGGSIVEVGCWRGKSISYLAVELINSQKNIKLYAVDTWLGSSEHQQHPLVKQNKLFEDYLNNIKRVSHVITSIRKESVLAAKDFEDNSIDAVFIDGCHEPECVTEDINAWYPKVKINGILAGHDWHNAGIKSGFYNSIISKLYTSNEINKLLKQHESQDVFEFFKKK